LLFNEIFYIDNFN